MVCGYEQTFAKGCILIEQVLQPLVASSLPSISIHTILATGNQVNVINSLRAVAAILVCLSHFVTHTDPFAGEFLPDGSTVKELGRFGHYGVHVFFVVSGFVIPLSLYYAKYKLSFMPTFLLKRLVRLHPPMILCLLLYVIMEIFYWLGGDYTIHADWNRIFHNVFLTADFAGVAWFVELLWTLAIEFQYYIVIALIFPLFNHKKDGVVLLSMMAFCLSSHFFSFEQNHVFIFYTPVFAMGIAAFLHHIGRINWYQLLVLYIFCFLTTRQEISLNSSFFALGTALVISFVRVRIKPLEWTGDISYSLYLTHSFAGCTLMYHTAQYAHTMPAKIALILVAMAVSIAFAWLFERVIEKPSIRWSQAIKYKK